MGIAYHLMYFTTVNPAAYLFGALFILQGGLLLFFGVFQNKLSFRFRTNTYGIVGIILIVYALIVYPVLGFFLGHRHPVSGCRAPQRYSHLAYCS